MRTVQAIRVSMQQDELTLMPDMRDFLALLIKHQVDFIIVGAFVLARYGIPRGTGAY